MMKNISFIGLLVILFLTSFFVVYLLIKKTDRIVIPMLKRDKLAVTPVEKPLEKYSFERLQKQEFTGSPLELGEMLKETKDYTSHMYYFRVGGKKVSGLMNLPKKEGIYPVLVMLRGYVPKEKFTTGEGTRRSAEAFATYGFITLAPDFLGYGESENPSDLAIEERFQTYTTALTMLSSVKNLSAVLLATESGKIKADGQKIGVWGHSNGGHIALSALAISGKPYPTVLWNPVTKPFPYSILYFTDEFDDHGKALRKVVADFEKDYDAEKYSSPNYYSWIQAPMLLQQASDDEAVPQRWSDQFTTTMKELEKDVTYITYPGDDHNFSKGSWTAAIGKSISFYQKAFAGL